MPLIFKAKTREGFVIKNLAELLTSNLKTGCFVITQDGIRLKMMDTNRRVMVSLQLDADNFSIFRLSREGVMNIGLNLSHFYKMLKSMKKKDSIVLFRKTEKMDKLGIRILPKDNTNRTTTTYIQIQNVQSVEIDEPTGYNKSIITPSSDYQKTVKELSTISNTILLTSRSYWAKFYADATNIFSKEITVGEHDDDNEEFEDDNSEDESDGYEETFESEQLTRIMKISGLSESMQMYAETGMPLHLRSAVGNLGFVSVYVKSHSMLHED